MPLLPNRVCPQFSANPEEGKGGSRTQYSKFERLKAPKPGADSLLSGLLCQPIITVLKLCCCLNLTDGVRHCGRTRDSRTFILKLSIPAMVIIFGSCIVIHGMVRQIGNVWRS